MDIEDQMEAEYNAAPEAKVLEDAEYERIRELGREGLAGLTSEQRTAYFSTQKYHYGQRQKIGGLAGMVVGGKTVEEILAAQAGNE